MAIITISRGVYAGVETLAELLVEGLGYRLYTREQLLVDAAKHYGASQSQVESAVENKPGFLEGRGMRKLHYIYCVQATMARAAQADDLVYHGQAGHLLLGPMPHHLRVRAAANMQFRIAMVMEQCNLSRQKAVDYLKQADAARNRWIKWVHGVEADDIRTYDLVVNLERVSFATAAAIIAETSRREFQTTPESQQMLDDLVIGSEVRARIGLDRDIADDKIGIDASKAVITISANVRSLADVQKAKELASQVPGVKQVETEIGTA
ncbi:MAG: cytidylate kinase family protein [Gemmatimonadota bacterium]|nr:MAG: cytidylate kinase family protein [Gemmatimonadota bacterium]